MVTKQVVITLHQLSAAVTADVITTYVTHAIIKVVRADWMTTVHIRGVKRPAIISQSACHSQKTYALLQEMSAVFQPNKPALTT